MRVLLALDGSASSDAACQLVGSLSWPEATVIQVLGVVESVVEMLAPRFGSAAAAGSSDGPTDELEQVLDRAVAALDKPTLIVRREILVGRPATLIVDAATDRRAELVVVGSRGRGPLASMLLGSVSAEVVDHAPCPVLVVRRPVADSVLVAVDGSPSAIGAVNFLRAHRITAERPIEVLTVVQATGLPDVVPLAGVRGFAVESPGGRLVEDRRRAEAIAAGAAQKLRGDGYHARWSISTGNAAHEIISAAEGFGSGLVVVGSRGHTGLSRIVLGSVARNVLLHTSASVLVVREPLRERSSARAEVPASLAVVGSH